MSTALGIRGCTTRPTGPATGAMRAEEANLIGPGRPGVGLDALGTNRGTDNRVKRGAKRAIVSGFVVHDVAGGFAARRDNNLPSGGVTAAIPAGSIIADVASRVCSAAGWSNPPSGSLLKSTHWISRQRGSARATPPLTRGAPAAAVSPGDLRRCAPAP